MASANRRPARRWSARQRQRSGEGPEPGGQHHQRGPDQFRHAAQQVERKACQLARRGTQATAAGSASNPPNSAASSVPTAATAKLCRRGGRSVKQFRRGIRRKEGADEITHALVAGSARRTARRVDVEIGEAGADGEQQRAAAEQAGQAEIAGTLRRAGFVWLFIPKNSVEPQRHRDTEKGKESKRCCPGSDHPAGEFQPSGKYPFFLCDLFAPVVRNVVSCQRLAQAGADRIGEAPAAGTPAGWELASPPLSIFIDWSISWPSPPAPTKPMMTEARTAHSQR